MAVRNLSLALAVIGALGLAAAPNNALGMAILGSEPVSALVTGAVFMLVAAAVKRAPQPKR